MITKQYLPAIAVVSIVVVGVAMYYRSRRAEAQRIKLAKAVAVLPPGTKHAWDVYLDRMLKRAISARNGSIQVTSLDAPALNETIFVSRNMPWQLTCDPLQGASVEFGFGIDSISVPVYGGMNFTDDKDAPIPLLYGVSPEPPSLGVDARSIAAKRLSEALCGRISAYLQTIMAPGSAISIKRAPEAAPEVVFRQLVKEGRQ